MSESKLQFRVGLFVITSLCLAAVMIARFGEMRWLWDKQYTLAVNFDEAPGVTPGIPVRKNGVTIGSVREIYFEDERGGVTILLDIQERHVLRKDSQPRLVLSLLGDPTIEFSAGRSQELLKPGARLKGETPSNPLDVIRKLEAQMTLTLKSFDKTSRSWNQVADNLNVIMDTNRGNLDLVVERAADSLHHFTLTMQNANRLFGDPENIKNLRETLNSLALVSRDTRAAILVAKTAIENANENLQNLKEVTMPLAKHSDSIVSKLDQSAGNLELLLAELNQFARALSSENGTLKMLATDPTLYRNLNRSASSLDVLLQTLQPILQDVRILSDKLARHPELLGFGGALRGSSGLKSPDEMSTKPGRISERPSGRDPR